MKWVKRIDCWIQSLLIIGFTVASFINASNVIVGYFVVGSWQVLSMLVHGINKWFYKRGSGRYVYHVLTAILVSCMLLGTVITPLLFVFWVLLYLAPFLAFFYLGLCYDELLRMMKRPLSILK